MLAVGKDHWGSNFADEATKLTQVLRKKMVVTQF